MASLVAADDQRRVRISPKVFADVPSRAELDAVKKNRNGLAVFVVLLLGALGAAVAALVYTYSSGSQQTADTTQELTLLRAERGEVVRLLTAAETGVAPTAVAVSTQQPALGTLNQEVERLTREREEIVDALALDPAPRVGELDNKVRELQASMVELQGLEELTLYKSIQDNRVRAAELRDEISDLIAQEARAELRNKDALPRTVDLDMYYGEFPAAWTTVVGAKLPEELAAGWKQYVEDSYALYASELRKERDSVLAWKPRGPSEGQWTPPARGSLSLE